MRKLIVAAILVLFLVYCALAHQNRNLYELPRYQRQTLAIRGDVTERQWHEERFRSQRYERLSLLNGHRYELAEPVSADGQTWAARTVLTVEDYEALVNAGVSEIAVLDPAAVYSFADRRLRLRQDVTRDGEVIAQAGAFLDKETIDRLLDADIDRAAVVGAGNVVGFNATVWMVILIFIGMTLALQEIFWQPMMELLDRRNQEIRDGAQTLRANRSEHEALEAERRAGLRQLHHEYQQHLAERRRETMTEVDGILSEGMGKLRAEREQAEAAIRAEADKARETLQQEVDEYAGEIRKKVVGSN